MGSLNGDVANCLAIVQALLDDIQQAFPCLRNSILRDVDYVSRRAGLEGLSFFTKTLPSFGKAFNNWLKAESSNERMLGPYSGNFLRGLESLIKGPLSDHDRAWAYLAVRQLSFIFYKLSLPPDDQQLKSAFDKFVRVDDELCEVVRRLDPFRLGHAASLIGRLCIPTSRDTFRPKHGPGAVSTGERDEAKWAFKRKFLSLHSRFPMYDWFVPSPHCWRDVAYALKWYQGLDIQKYPTARVVAVPKDSRGPRLISEEPLELQYMQQAWKGMIYSHLESHPLSRTSIHFTYQDYNQEAALRSSKTGELATLDLEDASDRVSDGLVYFLFGKEVYRDLSALRSRDTILPDGRIIHLNKFAPMGSAICFPIEALCFWAITKAAMQANRLDGELHIYGDDIIVPVAAYDVVCGALEEFGLKVNQSKSYHTGFFRESCGVDAWKGHNVTPVYVRQHAPSRHTDAESVSNLVACSNFLHTKGFQFTANLIKSRVDSVLKIPVNATGCTWTWLRPEYPFKTVCEENSSFKTRFNKNYCRLEIKCWSPIPFRRPTTISGWQRLHRNLLMKPRDPNTVTPRMKIRVRSAWAPVQHYGDSRPSGPFSGLL